MAGAAVMMEDWRHDVPAILIGWYSGHGGRRRRSPTCCSATSEPGGRLPFAVPRDEADLPPFDKNATAVTYDRWYGQRLLDRDRQGGGVPARVRAVVHVVRAVDDASAAVDGDVLTGPGRPWPTPATGRAGTSCRCTRPVRTRRSERFLVGFARVEVARGSGCRSTIEVPLGGWRSRAGGGWQLRPGPYRLDVAGHAADPDALTLTVDLPS